ncbi:hypothetical protein RDWZM_008675 [Blomia tropicalis]|uniref:Uncharacterized protein n=1 Tax=Blomia tropicalis TaxID=40697 RepID=A0A9Q0LZV0_BLOTA|nr:hypothetical protein RDWZM_008675 [Blomia tropicalis]
MSRNERKLRRGIAQPTWLRLAATMKGITRPNKCDCNQLEMDCRRTNRSDCIYQRSTTFIILYIVLSTIVQSIYGDDVHITANLTLNHSTNHVPNVFDSLTSTLPTTTILIQSNNTFDNNNNNNSNHHHTLSNGTVTNVSSVSTELVATNLLLPKPTKQTISITITPTTDTTTTTTTTTKNGINTKKINDTPPPSPPPPSSDHNSALWLDDVDHRTTKSPHRNQSDLISSPHCEYGTVWKYSFRNVVQSRLTATNGTMLATIFIRCLHQVTWGDSSDGQLNGQKYLVYIADFRTSAIEQTNQRTKNRKNRLKRSMYQYFEHLWTDFKSILPFEETENSVHDEFDQDLLRSMESELRVKCHSLLFWEELRSMHRQGPDKCVNNCHASPLSKFSLPFWFIQLTDGSIPQIRFTKQETNVEVKNMKKLIVTMLATRHLNTSQSNETIMEKSVLGVHRSHYATKQMNGKDDISNELLLLPLLSTIERHIDTDDFIFIEQNYELPHFNNIDSNNNDLVVAFPLNISSSQTQRIDIDRNQIVSTNGKVRFTFGPGELSYYSETENDYSLEREEVTNEKIEDLLNELHDRYRESQKETLVAESLKGMATLSHIKLHLLMLNNLIEQMVLQEKYTDSLYRLRTKLGRNEYHYYTKLFECATNSQSKEYSSLMRIVVLEQQLNHTTHQHNSLIGDIRRIGTIHNIQLVCGQNLIKLQTEKCLSFLSLLLQSSSKTAQHVLLYGMQNQSNQPTMKAIVSARLLAQTYRPSKWLVENLAHETHHQSGNLPVETVLLQTLTLLAQREQLIKLKELLSVHLVKRVREALQESNAIERELYMIDLLEMIGNLDNYTALQSVQNSLDTYRMNQSHLITIARIHAYRRSINRSQVQNRLVQLFADADSCQIKQQIVQLLIDDIDRQFWHPPRDNRWPKYGFEQLDQILANELRKPSTNCVFHLIIEYYRRKVNVKARKLVHEFAESSQNYNASSFDFCIAERSSYQCDYVQTLETSTSTASVEMKKSISIANTILDQDMKMNQNETSYIHTRHTLSTMIYRYKLTIAHLSVIQIRRTNGKIELRAELLQIDQGISIPLGRMQLDRDQVQGNEQMSTMTTLSKIVQIKLTIPVKVANSRHMMQSDNALLIQMNAAITISLVRDRWNHSDQSANHEPNQTGDNVNESKNEITNNLPISLQVHISLHHTGEFIYSGLVSSLSESIRK